MNQTKYNVRLAALVLSAGLVSCAKDETKKVSDKYKAPPPVIYQNGKQDLKNWERRDNKSLDLQDSFDVSAGNPASLIVKASCRRDHLGYSETFAFVPRAPIKIFQVLPPELLTHDLANEKTACSFTLTLSNEIGSKHIYEISSTPLTDATGPGIALEKTGSDEKVTQIYPRKLEGLRARYKNTGAASAQIYCRDMSLADLPFEQVADLIHFDFTKPEIRAGLPPYILEENPNQLCRLLIKQNGSLQQLSALFTMSWPQKPLITTARHESALDDQQTAAFFLGQPISPGEIFVNNPDQLRTRLILIEKKAFPGTVEVFGPAVFPGSAGTVTKNVIPLEWLYLSPISMPGVKFIDQGNQWRVEIGPRARAVLRMTVQPPRGRACPKFSYMVQTLDLAFAGKINFREISETGKAGDPVNYDIPRKSFPSAFNYESSSKPIPGIACVW